HAPSMVLSLACAFTGYRWTKLCLLVTLEDKLIGGGGRCKEPCDGARRALAGCHSGIWAGATPCSRPHWRSKSGAAALRRCPLQSFDSLRAHSPPLRCC